jgi:hypothetical protein
MGLMQAAPFVVEVIKQPPATPDISVSVAISVLLMPLVVMAAAALGGLCVGGVILLYKRWRDGSNTGSDSDRVRLHI